jgi:hypothetical protein
MTKKITTKKQIANLLTTNSIDGMTVSEIAKALNIPNRQIYVPLWQMKQAKALSYLDGYYRLTEVNKPIAEAKPAAKPEAKVDYDGLLRQYMDLVQRVTESLENDSNFERKYYDALAVIKYLEGRRDGDA